MDVPQPYKTAAICNIIGGVLTILTAGAVFLSLIMVCIGVLWVIPMAVGAWQVWIGIQMNSGKRIPGAATTSIVGAVTAFMTFQIISTGLGIFAYLQLQDDAAKAYIEG